MSNKFDEDVINKEMNIFDRALEEISCINQDLIQLFDNSSMNIKAIKTIKALELGKLYEGLVKTMGININYGSIGISGVYDVNKCMEIFKKIKELENE